MTLKDKLEDLVLALNAEIKLQASNIAFCSEIAKKENPTPEEIQKAFCPEDTQGLMDSYYVLQQLIDMQPLLNEQRELLGTLIQESWEPLKILRDRLKKQVE